jgi:hypothetical protein
MHYTPLDDKGPGRERMRAFLDRATKLNKVMPRAAMDYWFDTACRDENGKLLGKSTDLVMRHVAVLREVLVEIGAEEDDLETWAEEIICMGKEICAIDQHILAFNRILSGFYFEMLNAGETRLKVHPIAYRASMYLHYNLLRLAAVFASKVGETTKMQFILDARDAYIHATEGVDAVDEQELKAQANQGTHR